MLPVLAAAAALGAAGSPALRLTPVARLSQPVTAAAPPHDLHRLVVAERSGRLMLLRDGRLARRPFLDLRRRVQIRSRNIGLDQGGMLSLAFAPDYATSRRFYVLYTDRANRVRVDEFRRARGSANRADPASRRLIISVPRRSPVDVAGALAFGPGGRLFASFGEGSDSANSQDLSTLQGKLLRLDPRPTATAPYRVPAGNPFTSTPGARPEIWALGLRTPWRLSFDRGAMAVADVGETAVEEIDYAPAGSGAGANYGWPFFEGDRRLTPGGTGLTAPVIVRPHGRRTCAVIGGLVAHDPRLPGLAGRYLYGDLCSGDVRSAHLRLPSATGDRRERVSAPGLDSFAQDGRRRIYLVTIGGPVYRLDPRR